MTIKNFRPPEPLINRLTPSYVFPENKEPVKWKEPSGFLGAFSLTVIPHKFPIRIGNKRAGPERPSDNPIHRVQKVVKNRLDKFSHIMGIAIQNGFGYGHPGIKRPEGSIAWAPAQSQRMPFLGKRRPSSPVAPPGRSA